MGLLLILLSTLAYGAMPILAKLAYAGGVRPAGLLAYRFSIAALLFALMASSGGPALPFPQRARLWGLGLVFVGNAFAYFRALETVPASIVAMLLYTYPVLVTLLAALLGLDPLTPRGLAAAGLSFGGAALTAGAQLRGADAAGTVLALVAAMIYATYIVLGSRLAAGVPSVTAAGHVAQACAAVFVPWAALAGQLAVPPGVRPRGAILGIAVVCTVLPLRAFLAGLARVGPARAAVASSMEVVFTVALAVTFLGETIGPRQWSGGALILGGVLLQNLGLRRRTLAAPPVPE